MGEQTDTGAVASPAADSRPHRFGLYAAAWVAGAVPLFVVITALWKAFPVFGSTGTVTIGVFAVAFPVVVRRLGVPRRLSFVRFLLVAGVVFGIVSVLTGWGNGLTDEPFTTPRFVTLLWAHQDPYVVPLVFNYVQYGQTIHSYSIYPYLPLLMFLQVPGIDYKWLTLACWVAMVLLIRKNFDAGVLLAQPYVAVMAASGYNDFPVLLLLTLAFFGWWGSRQRWAQLLALGAKQFANVIVLAYYLLRRDWKNFLVTAAVSAAFILPFVVWSGPVVLCPSVLADRLSSCPSGGAAQYLLNYALWPIWVIAAFYPAWVLVARSSAKSGRVEKVLRGRTLTIEDLLRVPAFAIVGTAGAMAAITGFLGLGIYVGASPGALAACVIVGWAISMGWIVACDRPPRFDGSLVGRPISALPFQCLVQGVGLALNLACVVGALAVGRPALDGEVVGAFVTALWVSLVLFRLASRYRLSGANAVVGRGPPEPVVAR